MPGHIPWFLNFLVGKWFPDSQKIWQIHLFFYFWDVYSEEAEETRASVPSVLWGPRPKLFEFAIFLCVKIRLPTRIFDLKSDMTKTLWPPPPPQALLNRYDRADCLKNLWKNIKKISQFLGFFRIFAKHKMLCLTLIRQAYYYWLKVFREK